MIPFPDKKYKIIYADPPCCGNCEQYLIDNNGVFRPTNDPFCFRGVIIQGKNPTPDFYCNLHEYKENE